MKKILSSLAFASLQAVAAEHCTDGKRALVIKFTASWCAPCKTFAPVFAACEELHPDVAFGEADIDTAPALAAALSVRSIPAVMVLSPTGEVLGQVVPGTLKAFDARLSELLAKRAPQR